MMPCQKNNETMVQLLLSAGCDPTVVNLSGEGPILCCCRNGKDRILDLLLTHLDANSKRRVLEEPSLLDGFVPLVAAAEVNQSDCIRVLRKHGADLEIRTSEDNKTIPGATALHIAAMYGRLLSTKTLLELGANVASQTVVHGSTPIHLAIKNAQLETSRFLIGVDKKRETAVLRDIDGHVPGYYARMVSTAITHCMNHLFCYIITHFII
jgi:ankyrin repeat protein